MFCRPISTSRRDDAAALVRLLRAPAVVAAVCAGFGLGCSDWFTGNHETPSGGGRTLWHVPSATADGAPAFDGTTAFFLNASHMAVAVDGQTGVVRWSTATGTTGGTTYGFAGCTMAQAVVVCGDEDLVGFRPSDGERLWRYHASVGYSPGYFSPVTVGSTIYAGSPSGTLYAIDAASGSPRWTVRPFPADTVYISLFDPNADSDVVVTGFTKFYVGAHGSTGGVVAVDAASGQIRWITYFPQPDTTIGTNARSTALWHDLVLAPSHAGDVIYALDRATGAILWEVPSIDKRPPKCQGTPVRSDDGRVITVSGSTMYSASLSCWLIAYDLDSHAELWRVALTHGSASLARIIADGTRVFVGEGSGNLDAFSASRPALLWSTSGAPNPFHTYPALGIDRVFASRFDGFYALSK